MMNIKKVNQKNLVECKKYLIRYKGKGKLEVAEYTEQDNGNMWLFESGKLKYEGCGGFNGGFLVTDKDKIYERI